MGHYWRSSSHPRFAGTLPTPHASSRVDIAIVPSEYRVLPLGAFFVGALLRGQGQPNSHTLWTERGGAVHTLTPQLLNDLKLIQSDLHRPTLLWTPEPPLYPPSTVARTNVANASPLLEQHSPDIIAASMISRPIRCSSRIWFTLSHRCSIPSSFRSWLIYCSIHCGQVTSRAPLAGDSDDPL